MLLTGSVRPRIRFLFFVFLTIFLVCLSGMTYAGEQLQIPEELKPWVPWVMYNQEEKTCTLHTIDAGRRFCTWPGRLELKVSKGGARFSQQWFIETKSLVYLPGNIPFWPRDVRVNDQDTVLSKKHNQPALWLDEGVYTITGYIPWKQLPEFLLVPPETGIVTLNLEGKNVESLQLDQQGRLWFAHKKKKVHEQEETLTVQVFRKIIDGVPLTQQLHIVLTVSGNPREVTLGLETGHPFIPLQLQSPLPVRLDDKGRLKLQVRPGQWSLDLTLRNILAQSPGRIDRGNISGPWPTQEIWVFQGAPELRQVEVTGGFAVDPSRTSLPKEWQNLPAYLLKDKAEMVLVEKHRGNPHPAPNRLQLKRKIWLDEEGSGLTILDTLSGHMNRGWRLNVQPPLQLGRAEVQGESRLITRLGGPDKIGVELRRGTLALRAESRLEQPVKAGRLVFSALGWQHMVEQLAVELNLPPGWKLFTASGVDKVPTWLNRWTLLDIFLVLLTALATGSILGRRWGVVALCTLVLVYHQPAGPTVLWIPLLAMMALQKIMPPGGEKVVRLVSLGLLIALIVTAVPFMINEVRVGLYPQLERGRYARVKVANNDLKQDDKVLAEEPAITESVSSARFQSKKKVAGSAIRYSLPVKVVKRIRIDPSEMIQTGPGLPDWHWKTVTMRWNGPVRPGQQVTLFLLSPLVNLILACCRVLLLMALLLAFLRQCFRFAPVSKFRPSAARTAVLLLCIGVGVQGVCSGSARAEVPGDDILQELQERLLEPPECSGECATVTHALFSLTGDILQVTLDIDVLEQSGVPLPGTNRQFDQVKVDGRPAEIVRLDNRGIRLLRLATGHHRIVLTRDLHGHNSFSFSLPMLPGRGEALLHDWTISGLHANGKLDGQVSLQRKVPAIKDTPTESTTVRVAPFVRVERTLHMDLEWSVETRVVRLSPDSAIALDIPLITGERVTTDDRYVQDNSVRVNMAPNQRSFRWSSALAPVDTISLAAVDTSSWVEDWKLDVSPIWHVESQGISAVSQTDGSGQRLPEYRPYPGESLQLTISRPKGVPGPVMTINRSHLVVKPGRRATETILKLTIMASRGLRHTLVLPPDIDLQKTHIDGREYPLQLEDNTLILPIKPGKQNIELGWRSSQGLQARLVTPQVDVGLQSVNASMEMEVPANRWILLAGGPGIGPAVLFWGELLVIVLIALLLGRIRFTPLTTLHWLLLSLGLSQIPAPFAALVVGWLLVLGQRKLRGKDIKGPKTFNLIQIALVVLTMAALGSLFAAIQQGLLGHPNMQIGGNGSMGHYLRWYQDRSGPVLPTAWVITVPLLVYRLGMLLWALWLAVALLKWLRWGWECFSDTVLWRKKEARKPPVVAGAKKILVRRRRVKKTDDEDREKES